MGRPRKRGVMLPEHVHVTRSRGHEYLTYQEHRGTPKAGPRIKLPGPAGSDVFWTAYLTAKASPPVKEDKTVAAFVRAYRASGAFKQLRDGTRRDYDRYLGMLEVRLGAYAVADITAVVLQDFHDSLTDTPVVARHFVAVIKTLFKWGVPRDWAKSNPARDVDMINHKSDGAEPWPQWAFDLINKHARWEVRTFVALGLYTGQRSADILNMKLSDITGDMIAVKQSKTSKKLNIPLHRDLKPVIAECRARGFIYMVPGPKGDPLDTNRWRALWGREINRDVLKKIGNGRLVKPHGLRKSAVCRLAEAGCTDNEIASVTGQSMPMVAHYKKLYDQEKVARRAVKKWEDGA